MTKRFIIMVFLIFSVACGGSEVDQGVPTLLPTAVLETDAGGVSPRATLAPDSNLPPTWTPQPQDAAGHVATQVPTPVVTRVIHVVQRNETLGGIAELYGVSVANIVAANDLADADTIEVGQQLIIP